MYNRELSDVLFQKEKPIATGKAVAQEGQLLIAVLEGGIEKVYPCEGGAAELPVGFSSSTRLLVDAEVFAKELTIPSAAPYTVDVGHTNLVPGQLRIYSPADLAYFTFAGAPAPGVCFPDPLTGILTFDVADKGKKIQVWAKRTLSVMEARTLYREGFLHNARAFEVYDVVGCFDGKGQIYTDQFDVSKDYSAGNLKTMAGGMITVGGAGTALPAHIRVISLPSLSNPYLGLEFNF